MVVNRIDAAWWHKLNGGLRYGLSHSFGLSRMPIVNEYPKSGGTWLATMLAEATGLPFPRDRLPMLRPSILHGHLLKRPGMRRTVILWRDGRDIMVSWYFHRMLETPHTSAEARRRIHKALGVADPADVVRNLPRFIEYCMTKPDVVKFSWPRFAQDWTDEPSALHTRYEDLLTKPAEELTRICQFWGYDVPPAERLQDIVQRNSFAARAKRQAGVEDPKSFLRKGIAGDWKTKFSPEALQVFNHYAGDALKRLGYADE